MTTQQQFARVHGGTGFNPLPREKWGSDSMGDRCCCPYCSPKAGVSAPNPDGVWDTQATDLTTGKTWRVHFPALHGKRKKRRT